ncbi:MAG: hypothetical protein OHK0023_08190 [Anaerolineae bacterium]
MTDQTNPENTDAATESENDAPQTPLGGFFYHQRKAAEAALKALGALIPPETRQYSKEAREQYLKSFKVLIDGARATVEREINRARGQSPEGAAESKESEPASRPSTTGKAKIKVEVS